MDRRSVLKFLTTLPVIGGFVAKVTSAKAGSFTRPNGPADPAPVLWDDVAQRPAYSEIKKHGDVIHTMHFAGDSLVEDRAAVLMNNYRLLHDLRGWPQKAETDNFVGRVTEVLSKHLEDWSLSAPFAPGAPTPETVFTVLTNPEVSAIRNFPPIVWSSEAMGDIQTLHGLDPMETLASSIGQDLALKIQMEVRKYLKEGTPLKEYALACAPLLGPPIMKPEDFSVRRDLKLKYLRIP